MHSASNSKFLQAKTEQKSYCIWRAPGESALNELGPAPEKVWDGRFHPSETFVFAPFNRKNHPALMIGEGGREAIHSLPKNPAPAEKEHFLAWVKRAIHAIKMGRFDKIVAARVQTVAASPLDPFLHFIALCDKYPAAYCYLWYSPSSGTWLGASPELLLERKENTIRTVALAGTRTGLGDPFGPKEAEEQGLVLNYLKHVLNPWLKGLKVVKQNQVKSGHLQHLINELEGTLIDEQADIGTLIEQIHPTPAVAGLPKAQAIAFIEAEEGMDRMYYSGFLGTLSEKKCQLYVNLRCMQFFSDTCFVYAGAGITAASDPEKEWLETEEKTKVVLLA